MDRTASLKDILKQKIRSNWQEQTIKGKMNYLACLVVIIVLVSVILDIWIVKLSLFDFRYSLSASEKVGIVAQAFESEATGLKDYVKGNISSDELLTLIHATDDAVSNLPDDYNRIGEERLAWTQKVEKAHYVYRKACLEFVNRGEDTPNYAKQEYELYDMLDYLKSYSSSLLTLTTVSVNQYYHQKYRGLVIFPLIILIIAAILLVAVTHTSRVMNNSLVEPIVKLVDASKRIEKNDIFVEDVIVDNKDEIGDLVNAFNKMKYATRVYITTLEEKRETLDRLHEEELKKKEVENQLERMKFAVLRHQINPHFLFNTLNVISGMASLEDAKTTEKMIKSLSSLFRYNLRTTEKENALEQEINVVKDYMYLQGMRFGNRIKFEIDVDPTLLGVFVPSFTIQPIVENCIVHGLASKEDGGVIRVEAHKTTVDEIDYIMLTISDTGVGMSEDELLGLMEKIKDSNELINRISDAGEYGNGIGVGNIYRRIMLMYPDALFNMESEEKVGTKTIIGIPLAKGEIESDV